MILKNLYLCIGLFLLCLASIFEKPKDILLSEHVFYLNDSEKKLSPNIYIENIDVGNLGFEEAKSKLLEYLNLNNLFIELNYHNSKETINFVDLGVYYDIDTSLTEAFKYSEQEGILNKLRKKIKLLTAKHEIEASYIYSVEQIDRCLSNISKKYDKSPKEAVYFIENDIFIFKEGVSGSKTDASILLENVLILVENKESGHIDVIINEIKPKYSINDLEKSTHILSSFTTNYDATFTNRSINLEVGSDFINNSMVMPNEVFSTSKALKPRTAENGYVNAGMILNGEPNQGIGGGVCQISSTLYMAALSSELEIVERRNHSLMVSYMMPASDAAIAEGYIDLKIKNNTKYPILIQSILTNNEHIVNIFGGRKEQPTQKISFESILLEETLPSFENVLEDKLLPIGFRQIITPPIVGAKYELYKIIHYIDENGKVEGIEKVLVNTSTYKSLPATVRVGTMPRI